MTEQRIYSVKYVELLEKYLELGEQYYRASRGDGTETQKWITYSQWRDTAIAAVEAQDE